MVILIKNMNCDKCATKIQMGLLHDKVLATVDVKNKTITLRDSNDYERAVKIIRDLGYDC